MRKPPLNFSFQNGVLQISDDFGAEVSIPLQMLDSFPSSQGTEDQDVQAAVLDADDDLGLEYLEPTQLSNAASGGPRRLFHGFQHHRMLTHAKIVIAAPDGDVFLAAVRPGPDRMRELPALTLNIDESPVTPLVMQARNRLVQFR